MKRLNKYFIEIMPWDKFYSWTLHPIDPELFTLSLESNLSDSTIQGVKKWKR